MLPTPNRTHLIPTAKPRYPKKHPSSPQECPILAAPQQFALNPKPQIAAGWGIGQSPTPLPHNPYNLQSTTTTQ